MKKKEDKAGFYIKSEGDLEVVALHETHVALAQIIGPELYDLMGKAPHQQICFKTSVTFDLFLILVAELFMESSESVTVNNKQSKLSLFHSIGHVISKHSDEGKKHGLDKCFKKLNKWINHEASFTFWCGQFNTQIKLKISRRNLLWFGSNTVKHNLLRRSQVLNKLNMLCKTSGHTFSSQEAIVVLEPFMEEVRSRIIYHSSYLVEMLGEFFMAINNLIIDRFNQNPTNNAKDMKMPSGLTSDTFVDLYGSLLVFHRYTPQRIRNFTPKTTKFLKMRYK